jgi:hypothetical protein
MERDAVEAASGGSGGPPTRGPPAPAGPTLWLPDSFAHQPVRPSAATLPPCFLPPCQHGCLARLQPAPALPLGGNKQPEAAAQTLCTLTRL